MLRYTWMCISETVLCILLYICCTLLPLHHASFGAGVCFLKIFLKYTNSSRNTTLNNYPLTIPSHAVRYTCPVIYPYRCSWLTSWRHTSSWRHSITRTCLLLTAVLARASWRHTSSWRHSITRTCLLRAAVLAFVVVTSYLLVTSLNHTHVSAPYSCSRSRRDVIPPGDVTLSHARVCSLQLFALASWRHTFWWRHSIARTCLLRTAVLAFVVVTSYLLVTSLYHTHVSAPYSCSRWSSWRHTSSPRPTRSRARASRSAADATRSAGGGRFSARTGAARRMTACYVWRSASPACRGVSVNRRSDWRRSARAGENVRGFDNGRSTRTALTTWTTLASGRTTWMIGTLWTTSSEWLASSMA